MGEEIEQLEARRLAAEAAMNDMMHMMLGMFQDADPLAGTDALLDKMDDIIGRFDLVIPGATGRLGDLRAASTAVQRRQQLQHAAEWAGDLPRMRALREIPWPETQHLLPDAINDMDTDSDPDWDEGLEDDEGTDAILPDPYADLAQGIPGALESLIASGVDLNLPGGEQARTALQAALEAPGRRVEHLERLIAAGADPSRCGADGEDPIFSAVGYSHPETVTAETERAVFDLLFRHGSNPNARSDFFGTATLAAIHLGRMDELRLMLDAGGKLDIPMTGGFSGHQLAGYTALMLAAPKPATFRLLLERGADPDGAGPSGESLEDFLVRETRRAEELADHDDWCRAHAAALATSLAMLRGT